MQRRQFLTRFIADATGVSASIAIIGRSLAAQAPQATTGLDSSNLFAMDQSASRPVRLPPKPGARVVVSAEERDQIEHRIRCQCGCTLDVYTCRTTDFSCQVSPSMHRDVMGLVSGGYSAQEILDAFVGTYGERVLMAPRAAGFNLFGWLAPFVALGVGAIFVVVVLRRWQRAPQPAAAGRARPARPDDATDEERARLDEAVRDDE
jgi:cytochrome c-type biogenesis protein CcmH